MYFDVAFKDAKDPSGVIPHAVDGIAPCKRPEGAKGKDGLLKRLRHIGKPTRSLKVRSI